MLTMGDNIPQFTPLALDKAGIGHVLMEILSNQQGMVVSIWAAGPQYNTF